MKKTVRLLSLFLALLMLVSTFAACGGTGEDEESKPANDTVATTDEGEKGLPALNWDGQEYRILGEESSTEWKHNFEVYREEMPEDVVGKAVYERNQSIYDEYGIYVQGYLTAKAPNKAKTMLESGEDLYDLLLLPPEDHHPLAMSGYLLDIYGLDYIDVEADGWQAYANKQLTMGGKLYYTTNKFLLQDKNRSWALFYNRDLAKALNLGYFETLVFNGEWTVDKLVELGKKATSDSDGVVGMTLEDNWGVGTGTVYSFCQFAYGAGFRLTDHGSDGFPSLVGASDKIIQILDKVYSLTANTDVYFCDAYYGSTNWDYCSDHGFMAGRFLVLSVPVSSYSSLTEKSNFTVGVLPNPKCDKDQEDYYAIPNLGNGSLLSVPASVIDTTFAGFALQAITMESVDTSYNAYIETKCKLQDAYDEDSAKCLDIIFDGVVYDIGFVSDIGGLGAMLRGLGDMKTNTYARLYDRLKKIAEKEIIKIRETYAALG